MKTVKIRKKYQRKKSYEAKVDIAKMASVAFEKAYENARKHGLTVVKREGDTLVKLYPDGKKEILETTRTVKVKKRTFAL